MSYQVGPPPPPAPPPHAHPRTNGLAITSMVLGIVGVVLFVFFAIPPVLAIVFGLVAIAQINASNGFQMGRGMAVAGVVLGIIELVVFIGLIASGGHFYVNFG